MISSSHLYIFVLSVQSIIFLKNTATCGIEILYKASFELSSSILNSKGRGFLEEVISIVFGIVDKVFFTSFQILSRTIKSSQTIFNSKSHHAGGPEEASTIVTLPSFICSTSFLSLLVISIEFSFLQYSFFIKFTVILA
jgi:hypothetical protein